MSMTNITGVEEVNIFKNDGTVIHITGPKSIVLKFCFFRIAEILFL
jgi:hypothetical protein